VTGPLLGHAFRRFGEPLEARSLYIKTLQRWPQYASAYFGLGLAEFTLGRREAALEALTTACRLDPKNAHFRNWLKKVS